MKGGNGANQEEMLFRHSYKQDTKNGATWT
jgi:hypothetical protein